MKVPVLALSDKPSSKSFSMTTFVADVGLADYFFCIGLIDASKHRRLIPKEELDAYFPHYMHDLRGLNISAEVDPDNSTDCVAAWIGNDFRAASVELELSLPRELARAHMLPDGVFWFEKPKSLLALQREHIENAMREVCRTKDPRIAELMSQTITGAPETLAAFWYTRATEEERAVELLFQIDTFRKMLPASKASVIQMHKEVIAKYSVGI